LNKRGARKHHVTQYLAIRFDYHAVSSFMLYRYSYNMIPSNKTTLERKRHSNTRSYTALCRSATSLC